MNKLLIITVLVGLLALSAESFRIPRQADEEPGTMTKIADTFKSFYSGLVNTASGYLESIKGMKVEEKTLNLLHETSTVVGTYIGIMKDQAYYTVFPQQ